MEVTRAGRPDRSVMIALNAYGLAGAGKACDGSVGGNMGERQAAISSPDRTAISGGDAKLMLLRMRKPHGGKRRAPQPVETGIRRHPHALTINQYFPDGIGTESLLRA